MSKQLTITVTLKLKDNADVSINGISEICDNIGYAIDNSDNIASITKSFTVKCPESPQSGEFIKN